MLRSQLIHTISDRCKLSAQDATAAIDTVLETISESLAQGNRVELRGFGSFGLKDRRARDARNPKTGETVTVPGKRVMFFKAGKELRARVDN